MYKIRKMFKFEGAHRLDSSYSQECQQIHGHSYIVEVFITSSTLNEDGMVIDFKKLKEAVDPLIEAWDHKLMLKPHDPVQQLQSQGEVWVDFNPTAENMAKYLHGQIVDALTVKWKRFPTVAVRIHETSTGWAEYSDDCECR